MSAYSGFFGFTKIGVYFFAFLCLCMIYILVKNHMVAKRKEQAKKEAEARKHAGVTTKKLKKRK